MTHPSKTIHHPETKRRVAYYDVVSHKDREQLVNYNNQDVINQINQIEGNFNSKTRYIPKAVEIINHRLKIDKRFKYIQKLPKDIIS